MVLLVKKIIISLTYHYLSIMLSLLLSPSPFVTFTTFLFTVICLFLLVCVLCVVVCFVCVCIVDTPPDHPTFQHQTTLSSYELCRRPRTSLKLHQKNIRIVRTSILLPVSLLSFICLLTIITFTYYILISMHQDNNIFNKILRRYFLSVANVLDFGSIGSNCDFFF